MHFDELFECSPPPRLRTLASGWYLCGKVAGCPRISLSSGSDFFIEGASTVICVRYCWRRVWAVGLGCCIGLFPIAVGAQNQIRELEEQLRQAAGTEQEAQILWQLARAYLLESDIIRAAYTFERLRELPSWGLQPFRRQALAQWAMLEESRSRFTLAAELRAEMVVMDREEGLDPASSQYMGDMLQWADSLSRAGRNRKAADIFWQILKTDLAGNGRIALHRLLKTLELSEINPGELEELTALLRTDPSLQYALFQVFDIYVQRELYEGAESLLTELIATNPWQLLTRVEFILQLPHRDEFVSHLNALAEARGPLDDIALSMRLKLLEGLGERDRAHELARTILDSRVPKESSAMATGHPVVISFYLSEALYSVLIACGDTDRANQLEAYMAEKVQNQPVWLHRYSQRLMHLGKKDEVLALWNRYVQQNTDRPNRYTEAGQTLGALGLHEESLRFLQEGHQSTPSYDSTLALADAALEDRDYGTALSLFDQLHQQGWVNEDWLATHISDRVEGAEARKTLVHTIIQNMPSEANPSVVMPPWQLLLAVELAADSPDWSRLVDGIRRDSSGRLAVLSVGRLWVLDRPDLIDDCLPSVEKVATVTETTLADWPAGTRLELARQIDEAGAHTRLDGKRIVASLNRTIPWTDQQVMDFDRIDLGEWRLARLWLNGLVAAGKMSQAYALVSSVSPEVIAVRKNFLGLVEAREMIETCADIRARAADLGGALQIIESWRQFDDTPQLRWLEACIHLWRDDASKCVELLEELAEDHSDLPVANDAIELVHVIESLRPDDVHQLAMGLYLEKQGRYEDADRPFRDLAIAHRGTPVSDWARLRLAKIAWQAGQFHQAQGEWERLIPDASLIHTAQESRWWMARWNGSVGDATASPLEIRRMIWEDVVLEGSEDLVTDLSRSRLERTKAVP